MLGVGLLSGCNVCSNVWTRFKGSLEGGQLRKRLHQIGRPLWLHHFVSVKQIKDKIVGNGNANSSATVLFFLIYIYIYIIYINNNINSNNNK